MCDIMCDIVCDIMCDTVCDIMCDIVCDIVRRPTGVERRLVPRAEPGTEREEQRRWPQEHVAAQEKLEHPGSRPLGKEQMTSRSGPRPKSEQVDRDKKDVPRNVVKGAQRDGRPGAKPTQHLGHGAQQKPPNTSQRAAVVPPAQPRRTTKLPSGLVPSVSHPTQPRGRLLTSTSARPNPAGNKKNAQGTVTSSAPPGAPRSLGESLQDSNKENIRARATAQPVPSRAWQPGGNRRALAHRQSSAPSQPLGTTNLQWPRPTAKGVTVGKDLNLVKDTKLVKDRTVVRPGPAAASRGTAPQPRGTPSSQSQAAGNDFRSRGAKLNPEPPKAGGIQARRVPKTPSATDRKKQLEEWVASKGKTYKRPPMMLLQKQAVKLSCRTTEEKEKQEDPEQLCLEKMDGVLTECLKLVEEGAREEEVSAVLSHVPRAEQFAKFWICRAKLLARSGPFDVTGLYQAAVCAGAVPSLP
ncbi:cytoskeleton-associated protein 2-like [Aegotheles albertisi]